MKIDYTLARVVPESELATAVVFHSQASSTMAASLWNPSTVPVGWRVLSWIGLAVILPLLAMPLVRPIVRRRSNSGNLALLASLTAISGISAFWMVGGAVGGLISASVFAAAMVLGFMINLGFLNFALQLEK